MPHTRPAASAQSRRATLSTGSLTAPWPSARLSVPLAHSRLRPPIATAPAEGEKQAPKKKKKKPNMTMGESFRYLAGSRYIRNLFVLVVAYGMSINMVEVTWKGKLKQAFPDPSDYSSFMGSFSSATGVSTLGMMFFGRWVFGKFGWGPAAMITPLVLLATGIAFFGLCLAEGPLAPVCAALGTTPLMLAVFVGACRAAQTPHDPPPPPPPTRPHPHPPPFSPPLRPLAHHHHVA